MPGQRGYIKNMITGSAQVDMSSVVLRNMDDGRSWTVRAGRDGAAGVRIAGVVVLRNVDDGRS
jgi:translation elongation factor EF-Tu-like GTPase